MTQRAQPSIVTTLPSPLKPGELPPWSERRRSIRRFLAYVRPYHGTLMGAIAFGIVRYIVPLAMPWSLKLLVDDILPARPHHPPFHLHWLMLSLCGLYMVYAVTSYWRSYLAGVAGHRIIFDVRQSLYLHVQRMSLSFFERQKIGAVVSRMTTDIASAQNFVGAAFVNTVMDLSCVLLIATLLGWINAWLTIVSLAVLPFYAAISYALQKRIRAKSRLIHRQLQDMSGDLHEQFSGIATIQAFTREEAEAVKFRQQSERYFDTVIDSVKLQSIALGATGFLTALGPIVVLWVGATEVWSGRLTIGELMAFFGYLAMLYQPIQRLTELNLILANSLAAMDRIFEVFDTFPEVQERLGATILPRVRGAVAFEDVGFAYDGRQPVLERIRLTIPAGTTVALIGPSGAGKSTLVKLIPRYYDVTSGRIMIDGIDIRQVTLKSLREQVALVSQEPTLFSGTIAENLRYGKPAATDAEMHSAARAAFADGFIEGLPEGFQTEIGERGVRLSGGQKQRLAIARAFLKNAPILLLDEPTSALDAESEELVKQALNRLLEGRTALIIAHRLSTIEHAHLVIVIEEGRLIEYGRHEDLLARPDGLYRRYAEHQLASSLLL